MAVSLPKCKTFQNTCKKYETSTGRCHRFIPSIPQEFDCRIRANVKPELKYVDLTIKEEEFKTNYSEQYPLKIILNETSTRPPNYETLQFLRPIEEKFIADPASAVTNPLSEMKESFQIQYKTVSEEDIAPPIKVASCYVSTLGREQQPAISVNRKGFWRWTDPYLTTNKSDFTGEIADDVIKAKVLTIYNVPEFNLPPVSGNRTMFDRMDFKNVLPNRLQARPQKIPHFGMKSEYQDRYMQQTFSKVFPYLHDSCTEFEDSLSSASRWQTLIPPGMYCSEYCTIGRGSVRQTIDQGYAKKEINRTQNCCPLAKIK